MNITERINDCGHLVYFFNGTPVLSDDVTKDAAKGAKAPPASLERDLCNGKIGVTEQRNGSLEATHKQITMWRHAKRALERSREVGSRNGAHMRQPLNGPLLIVSAVHPIFRTKQPPQ